MAEDLKVSGPVEIKSASKEQAALALLEKIINYDNRFDVESKERKYWLTLYFQCLKATSGCDLENILKEE
jgi:hypothetical protein